MRLNFCPYTTGLIVVFVAVFLHTVFILNEDPTLMAIYESGDPGNLAYGIMSLFAHPIYSQYNYFFAGYGWPFNDISFIVILLLKLIGQVFGFYEQPLWGLIDNQPIFNATMRAINFSFALTSILLFFNLSNHLFNNKKISFLASLFFMFLPWAAIYSYWLHPDATGMTFLLLSILYTVKFTQQPKLSYFYIAFVNLILTTFIKMYHGFYLFPIFFIFLVSYCNQYGISYLTGLFSKAILKIIISLPLIYLLTILIVHPYAIIDFGGGVYSNLWLFKPWIFLNNTGKNPHMTVPFITSFQQWLKLYQQEPLIYLNVLWLYLLIIPLLFRKKNVVSGLFVISVLFCNVYLGIVIFGNRTLHFELRYIYPIAPLLILNSIAIILFIWKYLGSLPVKGLHHLPIIFAILVSFYLLSIFAENLLTTTNSLLARATYQHSTYYQMREFILNNSKTLAASKMLFDIGSAPVPPQITWTMPHTILSWVPSKIIDKNQFKDYINPAAKLIWVSWESQNQSLAFIKDNEPQFLMLTAERSETYRHYIIKNGFQPMTQFQASHEELIGFTYWFPEVNQQLKTLQATKKLIEIYYNPNLTIGPTIVCYRKS
ncbi:MAG: hypothetical protein HC877_03150 [Thioploca sp.]|nr:hypothetical protein [Thioploca sp.]